jgi:dihydrofolate synthase/folylpolyglutamate synthase
VITRLRALHPSLIDLSTGRVERLLEALDRPQDRMGRVIHVAGTNGKGSTVAFLRATLEAAGHKVHAFTSPHLVRFNERIRVAGRLLDDEELAALLAEVLGASTDIQPSFFEVATAVAILAFARTPADACLLEVGLGGRLDSTNVVDRPAVTGIASLALDHQHFLGNRLPDIAAEKAGIAKAGVPLVTQLYPPPISSRIWQIAQDKNALWLPRGSRWDVTVRQGKIRYRDERGALDLPLPRLPGKHQAMNAALAVAMLRHQDKLEVPENALRTAMSRVDWPARMQRLSTGPLTGLLPDGGELWLDGGHNPSAARAIAELVQLRFNDDLPLALVFASLGSKNPKGTLSPFRGIAARVLTLPVGDHEYRDPQDLADLARSMGFRAEPHHHLAEALAAVRTPVRILIFGSLYLAGEALAANGEIPD